MKKLLFIVTFLTSFLLFNVYCLAGDKNIILNSPETNDINHTFIYSNIEIGSDVKPYSLTLSIENGYFMASNESLNNSIKNYYDFKGGTNTENVFVDELDSATKYKVISLNLKSSINLNDPNIKKEVITSIQSFLRNILFNNDLNKDAKFSLTFSELEMKFYNDDYPSGVDVIAFKSPNSTKDHYYTKIENTISWEDAYDIAASLKWNGLQGYLATITSEEEHNFIYNSLGSIEGWIGAAAITNADSIIFNKTGINWADATNNLEGTVSYGEDDYEDNDENIKKYWKWVSGPEAGTKLFDGYTNFAINEPNNYDSEEWVAEYGYGDSGKWNDYSPECAQIEGYYIEFGGFENDIPTVSPISLISTFRWKDYDFRNAEKIINSKIKNINFDENTKETEILKLIDDAIEESDVNGITSKIINKTINKNIYSFDIELSLGEAEDKETFVIHIEKKINIKLEENPKTFDSISKNILFAYISIIVLIICGICINKNYKINLYTKK